MLWRKILLASIGLSFLILVGVIVLAIIGSFLIEPDDNSTTQGPNQPSSAPNTSVVPATKAPDGQLSPESLELLVLYHELQGFLNDREFHAFCYGQASPAYEWRQRALELHDTQDYSVVLREAGLGAFEIRDLGWEYCQSQGRGDTPRARELRAQMKTSWLNALPTPTQSTASEETEYALFQERLRAGADCPELFDIRNSADPKSLDIPKMNDGLREIGCHGSSSSRPTPTPIDAPQPANTYTVQEYRLYRAIIDTPMSIPESQALPAIARQHNVTPDKVRQAADKVMTALSRNNWFGTPASEIKHASDWQGETQ